MAKRVVLCRLDCVISPSGREAESRNLKQTLFDSQVFTLLTKYVVKGCVYILKCAHATFDHVIDQPSNSKVCSPEVWISRKARTALALLPAVLHVALCVVAAGAAVVTQVHVWLLGDGAALLGLVQRCVARLATAVPVHTFAVVE